MNKLLLKLKNKIKEMIYLIITLQSNKNEVKKENKEVRVFNALPAGDYDCMVDDVKLITTSTGRPMMEVVLKLFGEASYQGAMLNGRKERYRVLLDTKYTGSILFNLLKALKVDVKAGDDIDVNLLITSGNLKGRLCTVVLDEGDYTDREGNVKKTNNVKFIKKYSENKDNLPF